MVELVALTEWQRVFWCSVVTCAFVIQRSLPCLRSSFYGCVWMRKLTRRFRVERLESRCLFAALGFDAQPTNVASVSLQDAASIDVSEVQGLRGAALEISFDHQRLQVDARDVRAGSAWGGKGMSIANVDNDEGTINIFVFSARETEPSHGSLVEIDFRRGDGDSDGVLPLIDINRLRLNDTEIFATDFDPKTAAENGSEGFPKLSLQFKIAPEGESVPATDIQAESVADAVVNEVGIGKLPNVPWNYQRAISPLVHENLASEHHPSELTEKVELRASDICQPTKMVPEGVDLAINQWSTSRAELKGPVEPAIAQDLILSFAPIHLDDKVEREAVLPSGIQQIEHEASILPEFSTAPNVSVRRGVVWENDPESTATVGSNPPQLDAQSSDVLFQGKLARLAVGRLYALRAR